MPLGTYDWIDTFDVKIDHHRFPDFESTENLSHCGEEVTENKWWPHRKVCLFSE